MSSSKSQARSATTNQMNANNANSATDRATETAATGAVNKTADQLMSTKAGSLSPWSAANYASNLDNISNTYNNIRGAGFRALNQSGFGGSPGATASVMNSVGQNQGVAQTKAYRDALNDSLNQTLEGANLKQGIAGQYGAQSQNESNATVNDAQARINEGSTLGDIAGGVGSVIGDVTGIGKALSGFKQIGGQGGGGLPLAPSSTVTSSVYGNGGAGNSNGFSGVRSPSYANSGVGAY